MATDDQAPAWTDLSGAAVRALNEALMSNGCMLGAVVGQVDYLDSEGNRCWSFLALPGQPMGQATQMANHLANFYNEVERAELRTLIRRKY